MTHELKILPQYFEHVLSGNKTFEYRNNDRGFQPGDTITLREYNPEKQWIEDSDPMGGDMSYEKIIGYSGRKLDFKIGYILPVENNYVVFSLLKTNQPPIEN